MRNLIERISKMEQKREPAKLHIEVFIIAADENWERRAVGDDVIEIVIGGHDTPPNPTSKAVSTDS